MSRIAFCLVLFGFCACAQEEEKGRIQGRVVDAVTKAPLRKVNVVLSKEGDSRGTLTDAAGNFAFEKLPAGMYRLVGERSGYARSSYGARLPDGPGLPVTLGQGDEKKGLDLSLMPQATLSGRIVDEDGDPLEGVQITLQRRMTLNGARRLVQIGQAQTNDRGEFRLSSINAGKYLLLATIRNRPGLALVNADGTRSGYVPTYFPGVEHPDQGQWLDFKAGQEVAAFNMVLRRSKMFRVRGRFTGGEPSKDMQESFRQVMLRPKLSSEEAFSTAGFITRGASVQPKDGRFDLPEVQPGRYILEVFTYAGGGTQRLLGKLEITVSDSNIEGIEVPEVQLASITATLKLEDESKPVNLNGIRVDLLGADMGIPANQRIDRKDGGGFEVQNLFPDRWRLQVTTNSQPVYLKSIRAGGKELEGGIIDLSNGGSAQVEVVVSGAISTIEGNVEREGPPRPGSSVFVYRLGTTEFPMIPMDPKGNFRSRPLGPGEYLVYAFEEISFQGIDPDLLKKLESKATRVNLGEGEKKTVSVKQISYEELNKALQSTP